MYEIDLALEARLELRGLRPFDARPLYRAIEDLRWHAETVTRNRKPLREPLEELPEASWEVRVGMYRVLYKIVGLTVGVLRVILKDHETTSEALQRTKR